MGPNLGKPCFVQLDEQLKCDFFGINVVVVFGFGSKSSRKNVFGFVNKIIGLMNFDEYMLQQYRFKIFNQKEFTFIFFFSVLNQIVLKPT